MPSQFGAAGARSCPDARADGLRGAVLTRRPSTTAGSARCCLSNTTTVARQGEEDRDRVQMLLPSATRITFDADGRVERETPVRVGAASGTRAANVSPHPKG